MNAQSGDDSEQEQEQEQKQGDDDGPDGSDSEEEGKKDQDWAEIYTTLLTHTNLQYDDIGERSPAQLNAILDRLPRHLEIKIGIPGLFGLGGAGGSGAGGTDGSMVGVGQDGVQQGQQVIQQDPGRPPKLSEIAAFCSAFGGK